MSRHGFFEEGSLSACIFALRAWAIVQSAEGTFQTAELDNAPPAGGWPSCPTQHLRPRTGLGVQDLRQLLPWHENYLVTLESLPSEYCIVSAHLLRAACGF